MKARLEVSRTVPRPIAEGVGPGGFVLVDFDSRGWHDH